MPQPPERSTDPAPEKRKRGRPRNTTPNTTGGTVQALDRGLVILEALARRRAATLSDLATDVDMPPSTVHRILATLQNHGFADFDTGHQMWAIGIGAFRVGSTFLARSNLIEASQKIMRALMEQTGETSNLGIADDGHIVFISQVETHNPIRAFFRSGTRSQMHASGIGKAILANMPNRDVAHIVSTYGQPEFTPYTLTTPKTLFADLAEIAGRGWAFDDQERYIGMRCIAAAIYNAQGETIAGLSVSGPSARFTDSVVALTGPLVQAAAMEVTLMIGGNPPSLP